MAERTAPEWRGRAPALAACAALIVLAGCASGPKGSSGRDGAESNPPGNLGSVADAEPRIEAIRGSGGTSKPYVVAGQSYVPIVDDRPLRESGLASWYGRKFHGQSTASGEPYDMYAMTAAHKTLPLPSYVRVRNPANGREVIVRVNDRGPFHEGRVIDLSYTAALKLDLLRGVAPVEIERITNEDIRTGAWRRPGGSTLLAQAPASLPMAQQVAATAAPAQSVAVPIALTTPVVDPPRSSVAELAPLTPAPAALPAPLPVSAAASASVGPATAARPADSPSPAAGFWVQIGAFSQRDGAVSFQEKVVKQMPLLAPTLIVVSESNMHRLQAGPYPSRSEALTLGEQVRNGLGLAPIVVERR